MFCPKCRTEYRKDFTTCADCNLPLVGELPPLTPEQLEDSKRRQAKRKARNRFITSLIVAPLFAPLTMFIILTLYLESIEKFIPTKTKGWLASFAIIMIDGAFISYVVTVIIGLPLYFIFKRFNLINYWTLSIGGALVASIPVLIGEGTQIKENYTAYTVLAACGFVVGTIFYLINNWKKTNLNAREGR
jgi:uncharacterized membrane protein